VIVSYSLTYRHTFLDPCLYRLIFFLKKIKKDKRARSSSELKVTVLGWKSAAILKSISTSASACYKGPRAVALD